VYDPVLGTFISADVVDPSRNKPESRNRFGYVTYNPLKGCVSRSV
jgi:hypothetical protein